MAFVPPSRFRSFGSTVGAVADSWIGQSCLFQPSMTLDQRVRLTGNSSPRGVIVEDGEKVVAVLKPGRDLMHGAIQCAREKICSDLAYHLGMPVPPVVLCELRDDFRNAHLLPALVALSAQAFPSAQSWERMRESGMEMSAAENDKLGATTSAMLPFDAWTGVQDRHLGQVVLGENEEGEVGIAFVDYAYSLPEEIPGSGTSIPVDMTYITERGGEIDAMAVSESLNGIIGLSEGVINEIVTRIAPAFLSPVRAARIVQTLLARRENLNAALRLAGGIS